MRVLALLFLLLYVTLLAGAVWGAWELAPALAPPNATRADQWKGVATFIPILGTLVTSLMTGIIALYSLFAQLAAARDLERLKKLVEKSVPAYGELYAAAATYYRVLAPLQTGDFNASAIETAEEKMKASEGSSLFVVEDFSDAWLGFWQESRFHKEYIAKSLTDSQQRQEYWRDHVAKDLGSRLNGLKAIARSHLS
jgi:hypothetical protein